jgi:hypothetical protein
MYVEKELQAMGRGPSWESAVAQFYDYEERIIEFANKWNFKEEAEDIENDFERFISGLF